MLPVGLKYGSAACAVAKWRRPSPRSRLDVGEADAGERTDALAAAERQHQMVEGADLLELRGKRVGRGRVHP